MCLTTLDRASSVVCNSLVQKSKMRILVLLASIGAVLCQEEHEEHHHEQSIPAANDDLHRKLQVWSKKLALGCVNSVAEAP